MIVSFYNNGNDKVSFKLNMPILPRIGETVSLPFDHMMDYSLRFDIKERWVGDCAFGKFDETMWFSAVIDDIEHVFNPDSLKTDIRVIILIEEKNFYPGEQPKKKVVNKVQEESVVSVAKGPSLRCMLA